MEENILSKKEIIYGGLPSLEHKLK